MKISVFGSLVGSEEIEEIQSSVDSQWLGMGPKTERFEKNFSRRLKLPNFVLLNSGSNALYMAVKCLDLPPGSEVVLPSFTWIGCAHAVALAGLQPVLCDVDYESQNVTAESIRSVLTKNSSAIMVVHYAGLPVDMGPILDLGYPIIEDAAHAVDSRHRGQACGTLGDIGVYSFDAVKNLVMGEGGGVTTRDEKASQLARCLRYCGIESSGFDAANKRARWWEHDVHDVFPKMLPSDVSASIGLAQLEKIDRLQSIRRHVWDRYQAAFASLEWLERPLEAREGDRHSYFTYCIRVKDDRRDELAARLHENGIYSTLRYQPLHHCSVYSSAVELPNSDRLSRQALNLPLHPRLNDDEITKVTDVIKSF